MDLQKNSLNLSAFYEMEKLKLQNKSFLNSFEHYKEIINKKDFDIELLTKRNEQLENKMEEIKNKIEELKSYIN